MKFAKLAGNLKSVNYPTTSSIVVRSKHASSSSGSSSSSSKRQQQQQTAHVQACLRNVALIATYVRTFQWYVCEYVAARGAIIMPRTYVRTAPQDRTLLRRPKVGNNKALVSTYVRAYGSPRSCVPRRLTLREREKGEIMMRLFLPTLFVSFVNSNRQNCVSK